MGEVLGSGEDEAHARDAAVPDARAGLASGPTLAWEGDLFGPTVNLASRLVNLARPRTVLVAEELGAQLRDDPRFTVHHLRAIPLQGCDRGCSAAAAVRLASPAPSPVEEPPSEGSHLRAKIQRTSGKGVMSARAEKAR